VNVADALFVLGCQRSGTTLLRFLLGSHPEVTGVDESAAYPVLTGQRSLHDVLEGETVRPRVAFKVPRLTEQLLESDLRDEVYGTAPQFYARQRAVFVTRDPLDVVTSMCTLKASANRSWIDAYGRAMVDHRVQQRAGFAGRYARELAALAADGWPPHLLAAFYWQVKNDALPAYVRAGLPILPLRYEALVADPEPHLRCMFAHLGLAWTPLVLRHHEQSHGQLEEGGLAIGGSDPQRPIDGSSVGRHAAVMSSTQIADVERWTAPTREALRALTPA
jgi:hypothetical protein